MVMTAGQIANIGRKTKPAAAPARAAAAPTLATRTEWAAEWARRLALMLAESPAVDVPGRIWRLRCFQDDSYTVYTIVEPRGHTYARPGEAAPRLKVFVSQGYQRATSGERQLFGEYSCDEVVAYLCLDRLNPDAAAWVDETKYTPIVATRDMVNALALGVH